MAVSFLITTCALVAVVKTYGIPQAPPVFINNHMERENNDHLFKSKNLVVNPPLCSVKDIHPFITLREVQEILERFSERENISPYILMKKLLERIKNKKASEDEFLNTVKGSTAQQFLQPKYDLAPPIPSFPPMPPFPPKPSFSPMPVFPQKHSFPKLPAITPYEVAQGNLGMEEPFLIMPNAIRSNSENEKTTMTQFFPLKAPLGRPFIPPETATVHVGSLPDVPVTVSPFMTVAEALRQADAEYRVNLGVNVNFSFSRSIVHGIECIIIKNINDVYKDHNSTWKLTISDKNCQIIYQDICLPDEKQVRVKPGTNITISA